MTLLIGFEPRFYSRRSDGALKRSQFKVESMGHTVMIYASPVSGLSSDSELDGVKNNEGLHDIVEFFLSEVKSGFARYSFKGTSGRLCLIIFLIVPGFLGIIGFKSLSNVEALKISLPLLRFS